MLRESTLLPGTQLEEKHVIKSVKAYLPADPEEGREHSLLQVYSLNGGLRTFKSADIIRISK